MKPAQVVIVLTLATGVASQLFGQTRSVPPSTIAPSATPGARMAMSGSGLTACDSGSGCDGGLVFFWIAPTPSDPETMHRTGPIPVLSNGGVVRGSARTPGPESLGSGLSLDSLTFTSERGEAVSVCSALEQERRYQAAASTTGASARAAPKIVEQHVGQCAAWPGHPAGAGSGEVTLHFAALDGTRQAMGTGCPITNMVLGTPIGGIIVKGGKNPGGQMRLNGASITHCDANGATASYQSIVIEDSTPVSTQPAVTEQPKFVPELNPRPRPTSTN